MSHPKQPPATPAGSLPVERETENAEYQGGHSDTPSSILHDHDAEKATQPKSPGDDTPDGGLLAWLVVLGAWCTSFCSFGWLNSTTASDCTAKYIADNNRCWSLPGVLPKRIAQRLLAKHHLVDSIAANLFHDGHGVFHAFLFAVIRVRFLIIFLRDPSSASYTIALVRGG